jgi:hypothetical protein
MVVINQQPYFYYFVMLVVCGVLRMDSKNLQLVEDLSTPSQWLLQQQLQRVWNIRGGTTRVPELLGGHGSWSHRSASDVSTATTGGSACSIRSTEGTWEKGQRLHHRLPSHRDCEDLVLLNGVWSYVTFYDMVFSPNLNCGNTMELWFVQPNNWIVFRCVQIGLEGGNQTMGVVFPIWCRKWFHRLPKNRAFMA